MTCVEAPLVPQFDLLQLAVLAGIAFGMLKAFMHKEDWFYPVIGALIPIAVGAVVKYVLAAFGLPTPLYGVGDGLSLILPSQHDLVRNAALVCAAFEFLRGTSVALAVTLGGLTTAMVAVQIAMIVALVVGAFTGPAGLAAAADVVAKLFGFYLKLHAWHDFIAGVLSIAVSAGAIANIMYHMAEVALWAPWLLSAGVPMLAFSRTRALGGALVAIAAVSMAVSYIAAASALDFLAFAMWGHEVAKHTEQLTKELEESGAGGTPAIATFGGGALWIGYYNNTYYVKSFKEAVEALKKDPDLRDLLPKNADEVIKALEQFVRQTKYTKNGTSPIYAGRVAAVEYGNKNWSLTALYVWLDVDVLGSWQSCENLTPPVVANFLRVAESQMPQKAGDFSLVKRVMHKLCQWYRNYSLISVYQFDWSLNPSTRRLMAQYAYNVTAYVTYSAGRAYAPVGLWGWVDRPRYLGPDGEYCKDVSGKQADCSSLLASRTAGAYKYDAAEAKWVLKRDPTPGNASSHFNFTVTRGGPPYLYQVVPLYEYYEYCKWCAQEINGTCVDWRVSVMRWYEQYRIDKKYYTAEKNYAVFFVEKPWRLRPPYTVENLKVPYLAVNYTVVKWWNHTEWSPPPGGSCVYQWVDWSTYKPYKWVGVERADSPHMRYVYAWAWAGGVELKFNYNRTVLEGLVYQNTTFDLWRDGAVYSAYCTPYVNTLPYRAVNTALLQFAVNNLTEVNKEALFALVATSNATKAAADARRMDEAYQKVVSRLSRENATGAREALALVEASKAIVDLYKEGYRAGLYMPLPNIEPSSYRLHHVRLVCLNFHWNATTLVNGTLTITAGREPWVFSFPFGYSNLTKVLIHGLDQFYRLLFEKGVPPPPARVVHTVTYRMGNKTYEYTVNGTPSFYFRTWWDGSPLSYQPANYTPVSSLPTSVWGVPYFAEWFNVPYNALTAVGRAVAESWTRLIVGGIAALAAFEALGVLFGFPTPGRFLYSVAMDILSQLGYWLGIRLAIRAKLFRRLLRPFRVRIARAAKLIAAKLPRLPAPRLRIGGRVRDLREWLRERVRWRWLEEKIRRLEERMALPGVMTEWGSPVDIRRVKEHVKEVAGRVYHALQAHDVVEFLRRISPRVDAFISHIEAKLAERYPTLYKVYALYKGPYVAHYLLAEPVIRRWEAEGKITRAEADQLRRARQLLWAAAAEAKARAVEAEKGVGAKHLRDVFEHRENVVRKALEQLDLMPHAKTKEELAKHLGAAAAHLQHIDPAGTSRLWTALGIAAEGRPVDFHTTREVVEFLWERRERLDVIVQRAKELIAQHYAHAPLSIKDIAKEEVSRQVARVKPLLEAVAKARRYAATGEGAEEAVKALRSKEVKKAAKAAEVEIGALRKAAEKAAKLEEERKELASKIEELRKRAEAIRAEVDALRHSGPSKELEERQRRLEELYVEIERLQQRVASVEERLVEARRRLSVEAREVLEQAARSYRGVFEGVKHEVDPVYLELRRALVEGRLEEAYRQLREQYEREGRDVRQLDRLYGQLKSLEPELQKAREELRAAVKEHEAAIRAEAYVRAEAASELKQLFEKLPTAAEGDVRKGIEIARQVGLEKTAQFLEEYLRHGQVRERYARAASEAAEALRRLAQAREHVVKEQQAAEEKLRQVTLAEDALRRIGQTTEFEKSAKAAKETGLAKTAQFLERWAELVRQAEERGGLEVVNRLGRALVSGRLAEEASALAAEGKALGEWYGRVLELRSLYEEAVKEAAEAKAEAEAVVRTVTELRALIEKTRAESPADLVGKLSKIDVKELESAVKAARSAGLEAAARYFEELANFVKSAEEKAKALREYLKAEKSLKALEAKASIELYRAEKVAEGLAALLEGREYGRLAYVREALKALDEETRKTLKKPLERLSEARREVELLRYSYTYEVGAPVWRKLRQRGVESLLLRAPLTAYVTATLESSLLRETAEAFRPAFAKYEREAATTIVYMPVGEGDKLGPVVSWERALRGEFRPYIEEIAETKAPTLKQAVKDYYAGRGRQFKELAYLEARAAEAVLDVHASKFFLERYAKEGRQEDLALAIALAYRAAKAYQRYQHSHLGQLADVVAEVRQRLGLTGRDVAALAKAVEQLGGEKALRESLRPKNVEEAVKWLREAWAAVDYRALESKLGLTRTYAIPEPDKALEYTAKALTPSRIAALTEGKVSEEAFSVMRTYSLLREFERFMKEKPREVATKAEPAVVRALDRPLPSLQTSAVDKVAKEAASRLVKEAEALAQQHGLKHPETLAVLEQIRELVKVSPEAFGKLVHAASRAKGPFKEWARKLVAEVRKSWDVYRESWEAPVVQRLEALRRVPAATEAPSPVPREFVALALWAELNQAKELKQVVKEISPAAVEEAALLAEAIRAIQRDLEKLKTVEVEKPVFITFETLEKKTVKGVEKLVIDEVAELSKASRYLQHQDPRVREEAELLLKFARGEITRTQLKEELSKRGGPVTEEGKEAVSVEQRLRDVRADLVSRLANEVAVLKEVGALRREAVGAAFYVAAKAGLGDEKAERELKALAAFNSRAVKYAETLKLLRVLSEGLDKAVYEPELAKKFPELRDVLLERDRALRRAEELERSGDPEKLIVAGVLREFAEGRVTRTQLLDVAREKGVDLSEFSERRIAEARGMVMERVKEMAAELAAYRDAPKSLREALEARMPMDLYAELANELRVKLEEAAAKAGIPAEYAKYGVLQGAAKYVEELTKLVTQLPVDVQAAYAALGAVRHELMAVDELKLLAELANGNFSTVERLRKKIEEAEAEVAKAVFNTIRELGVRRVPYELLEVAARVEFTPGELRMLLAELDAAKAAERDKAFAWPEFAEYVPVIFVTSDEKAAKTWRRGGGLVIEALVFVGDKPKRVYILAPRNAPVEEIREALYAIKGVEIVGTPKWLAGWDVAEALGFAVENTEKGVALKPRVEAFIDLDKPLPYRREVWEALKLTRPDLLGEAVGARWSLVHWEDGLAAVNAYLFLRKLARWDAFEPADIERVLEEYRRRYNPTFERYVKAMSVERLGFDVVDFLKGAYAVSKRLRGEAAAYKPSDAEAYARLIWWAKKVGRHASLYELLQPEFRLPETLKALNIAIKGGWITYSEALDLFNSWRRNNDVAKWDEEALKIALRGNLRMKETEEAIKRFVDSIKTSKQLEAEEAARERLKLMEEQKKREEEMKKIRGIKERPRAKPAETQQEAKREEVEQVKKEEAQPKAEETRQVKREEAQPEETKAARAEAERPAEEKPSEEVSYVKFGYVHVKSTHVDNAVVKAFAVEHPSNWHHKLTPEAYIELRAGLAPFELEKLEAARERAADRVKALSLLSERFGPIAVPEEVRRKAEEKAYDEFVRHVARLTTLYDEEAVEAVVNRLKALVAQWVEMAKVPNAYDFIYNVMWIWEGDPKTRNVREEWGYWLFREDFKVVKELAERYGIDVMRLWNAYRSAVAKYLDVVTYYGDVVKKAVTTIDVALRTTLIAAGGVALAEALHGVVRPELVGAATMAASMAMAGKYRDAVHVIKTAVERVKVTVEKAVEGVKIAVERLYEAVVEAAARIVQMLKEHWRAVALVAAAAAAGLITWVVAQQINHTLFIDHSASLAFSGFFGIAWRAEKPERFKVVDLVPREERPGAIVNEVKALNAVFDISRPEAERRDAAAALAKSLAPRLAYDALVKAKKQWLQSEAVEKLAKALAEELAKRELGPMASEAEREAKVREWRERLKNAEAALKKLADFIRREEERALKALKAVAEAYDKLKMAEVRVEFTKSRKGGEKAVVKLVAEGREVAELHVTKKTVRLVGKWGTLKANIEIKGGAVEFETMLLEIGVGGASEEGAELLKSALAALYEALPEEAKSWLRSESAQAYAVMYELADVSRATGELGTVELGSLLMYALVKYANDPTSIISFGVRAVNLGLVEAQLEYRLLVKDVHTTSPKEAILEVVAALGVDSLEKLGRTHPSVVVFLGGLEGLARWLGDDKFDTVKYVARNHRIDVLKLLTDVCTIAKAVRTPGGLLGLVIGDGSPSMSELAISVGEKWMDGMKKLLQYAVPQVELQFKERRIKRELKVWPSERVAAAVLEGTAKIAPVMDAVAKALYGYESVLWKWVRLRALAGEGEAKAMYSVWELSRDGLWPPPKPLREGKVIKYVKNGVELWIYRWDENGIGARVFDGDKTFYFVYTWRGAGVQPVRHGEKSRKETYAETFAKLGVSTKKGEFTRDVRELLKEAVQGGEAVEKPRVDKEKTTREKLAEAKKVVKEKPAAERRAAEHKEPAAEAEKRRAVEPSELGPEWKTVEPVLLYKGEKVEVWLRAVKEKGVAFEVRHVQWEEPAIVKVGEKKSGKWQQLRGRLFVSSRRPLHTLREVAEELRAAGVPGVSVYAEGVQFGSSAVDYLMLRDRRAAELWFGEVLYWDDEVKVMYKAEGADREKYTIAVYDEGWHIYTLTYTRRREWEGVIYTTDRNAPERIKIALMKAARGTPYEEHVKNWQPILGKGEGSYRIHIGEWARDILAKNLKNHKK